MKLLKSFQMQAIKRNVANKKCLFRKAEKKRKKWQRIFLIRHMQNPNKHNGQKSASWGPEPTQTECSSQVAT